jgi:hypothetical protein
MCGDCHVLQHGTEFIADLFVQRSENAFTYQHERIPSIQ